MEGLVDRACSKNITGKVSIRPLWNFDSTTLFNRI